MVAPHRGQGITCGRHECLNQNFTAIHPIDVDTVWTKVVDQQPNITIGRAKLLAWLKISNINKNSFIINTKFLLVFFFAPFPRPFHYLVLSLSIKDNVRSQKQSCYWKQLAVSARLAGTTKVSSTSYQVKRPIHSKSFYAVNSPRRPASQSLAHKPS